MPFRHLPSAAAPAALLVLLGATAAPAETLEAVNAAALVITADSRSHEVQSFATLGQTAMPAALPIFALGFAALLFYRMRWR
ncbi:MAG: hypothetical protein AAFR84_17175 [Pseudomonadota bacterium]